MREKPYLFNPPCAHVSLMRSVHGFTSCTCRAHSVVCRRSSPLSCCIGESANDFPLDIRLVLRVHALGVNERGTKLLVGLLHRLHRLHGLHSLSVHLNRLGQKRLVAPLAALCLLVLVLQLCPQRRPVRLEPLEELALLLELCTQVGRPLLHRRRALPLRQRRRAACLSPLRLCRIQHRRAHALRNLKEGEPRLPCTRGLPQHACRPARGPVHLIRKDAALGDGRCPREQRRHRRVDCPNKLVQEPHASAGSLHRRAATSLPLGDSQPVGDRDGEPDGIGPERAPSRRQVGGMPRLVPRLVATAERRVARRGSR
mmetsp:Transcript_39573/g.130970  ORF Transcript_39573/g.130970 Transcript_39573/m.130970 type:complete len:314 (-) Transcript_39573:4-945(-)